MAVDIHNVRRIALALPGVEERLCHGTPAFYARGKMLLRLREDGETLAVAFPKDKREALIDAFPDVFSVTDHYLNYDYVLLDMIAARESIVAEMIDGAWRRKASKRAVAAFDAGKPKP